MLCYIAEEDALKGRIANKYGSGGGGTMDIIGLFLMVAATVIFAAVGFWYSTTKHFSLDDFVSARSSVSTGPVIASLVAGAMGAWIMFSPAETAVSGGITALVGYALGSAFAVCLFAWLGLRLRKLMPSGYTLTEYVFLRFGKGMYIVVLLVSVFYMGIYLTAELTAIALLGQMAFAIPLWMTALIIMVGVLAYAIYGGLRASIFTDIVQFFAMVPLLILLFGAAIYFLHGFSAVAGGIRQAAPQLLSPGFLPGIETGIVLIIAIMAAELFNHGNWQRVFAATTNKTMVRSFLWGGVLVFPFIMMIGAFGLFAVATDSVSNPSVALFDFLGAVMPEWLMLVAVVLAVILVMSTIDTLINALASLFTVDVLRVSAMKPRRALTFARLATFVVAAVAFLIAMEGYSVLYLFLVADLVCAAAVAPVVYGLYSRKYSGWAAVISTLLGITAGALFFPDPAFQSGNLLWSFGLAFLVPLVLAPLLSPFGKPFDFRILVTGATKLEE